MHGVWEAEILSEADRPERAEFNSRGLASDYVAWMEEQEPTHEPLNVYGCRIERETAANIHALAEWHLQRAERDAGGRPILVYAEQASSRRPTWAVESEIRRAKSERAAAFAQGKTSAAKRPGQDVYARMGRRINYQSLADGFVDEGSLMGGPMPFPELVFYPDAIGTDGSIGVWGISSKTTPVKPKKNSRPAASDRRDITRMQKRRKSRRLDDVECQTLGEQVARQVADEHQLEDSLEQLMSKSRERRLTRARKDFIVRMGGAGATPVQQQRVFDFDKGYVSRVLKQHGVKVGR
jgi:hypothetical protein